MNQIAVLIMAAGQSRRFGTCKSLAPYAGTTVLQHTINNARQLFSSASKAPIYVVTGKYHDDLVSHSDHAHFIYNHEWHKGLSSSISLGVKFLAEDYSGVLILLADQIAITPEHLQQMVDRHNGNSIVCARYLNFNGVPALFPQTCFKYLVGLSGDNGAKQLLNAQSNDLDIKLIHVNIPEAAIDIDTPDDLEQYQQ